MRRAYATVCLLGLCASVRALLDEGEEIMKVALLWVDDPSDCYAETRFTLVGVYASLKAADMAEKSKRASASFYTDVIFYTEEKEVIL